MGSAEAGSGEVGLTPELRAELTELTTALCKALNDPKRLMVLYALRDGGRSVSELAELVEAREANVSQHLAVLRERGLVDTERQGPNVIYSLRHPELLDAVDGLRAVMRAEVLRRQVLLVGG